MEGFFIIFPVTYLELLAVLKVVLRGAWSFFSMGVSEADAEDECEDTDSLLPIDVSSNIRPTMLSDTGDTAKTINIVVMDIIQ